MSKMHLSDVMCLINQFLFEVSSTCWVISRWAVRQMLEVSDTALDTLVKSQCKNDPGKWSYFENSSTVADAIWLIYYCLMQWHSDILNLSKSVQILFVGTVISDNGSYFC